MFFLVSQHQIKHPVLGRKFVRDTEQFDTRDELYTAADEIEDIDDIVQAFELQVDHKWVDLTGDCRARPRECDPNEEHRLTSFELGLRRAS